MCCICGGTKPESNSRKPRELTHPLQIIVTFKIVLTNSIICKDRFHRDFWGGQINWELECYRVRNIVIEFVRAYSLKERVKFDRSSADQVRGISERTKEEIKRAYEQHNPDNTKKAENKFSAIITKWKFII